MAFKMASQEVSRKLVFKNLVEKIPERETLAVAEINDRLADFDRDLAVVSILYTNRNHG